MKALINGRVFDGDGIRDDVTVLIHQGRVQDVVPGGQVLPAHVDRLDLNGRLLAPGFIDIQVNGGGGVLFNDQPTPEGIRTIVESHWRHGTTGLLITLISDSRPVMEAAIAAVAEARRRQLPGLLGIHLEGPYLNPERRGIHPAQHIRGPEPDASILLASLGDEGITLVTLAPEQVPPGFIAGLREQGVLVAAGHSAAGYDRIRHAVAEGLCGFTHLFNAMAPLQSREPGVVGAALTDDRTWCSLIVDGYHVHPATLRIALSAKPAGQTLLVTDAMPTAGSRLDHFRLAGNTIHRQDGRLTDAGGTLAGADLTMNQAVRNARLLLGLPLDEALRMASLYPAMSLGLDATHGRIRPGYRADLVLLDDDLNVLETWIQGTAFGGSADEH
ncbi:MAG: N-acetylglucosamine-6-phosphate deacetylase [Ectothiorhodospiraceae bacterium]|nr:N-acetylglucosamine-6-phosphate deacetylase [Ectothiorhodospiraceae bacterium]